MPDHTPAHDPQRPEPRPDVAPRRLGDRIRGAGIALNFRLFTATAGMYVAAGSLIGFESVALLLGYAALWPVAIPVLIAVIVAIGTLVRRVRKRREGRH